MEGKGLIRIVEREDGKLEVNYSKNLEGLTRALATLGVQNETLRGVILGAAELILSSSEQYTKTMEVFNHQCDAAYGQRVKESLSNPVNLAMAIGKINKLKS